MNVRVQTNYAMWISHSNIKFRCNDRSAGSNSYEILVEVTGRLWLGNDNLLTAGVDTVSVWCRPCRYQWQLGLTSSQNQTESFTASVTSSVCREFVMGDCLSGSINRHHCTTPQWHYMLPLMQIFTEQMKEIHFLSHRPHTDASWKTRETCSSQEMLCSGGRGE